MAEGGGLLPPIVAELRAKSSELVSELGKVKTEVKEMASETETHSSKMSTAFQGAASAGKAITFGLAGAAIAVGGFALEAATAGEKVDAQLSTAIKNAGGNMEELDPKISKVDGTLRGFGFTNEETNASLARLTTATKDPEKALNAVSVAADLARSRNIPLATATDLVAKAMAGQTGALKRMGIDLPIAAGGSQKVASAQAALAKAQTGVNDVLAKYPDAANKASKGHAAYEKATAAVTDAQKKLTDAQSAGGNILNALESRVKGAASAYGDTLAGKMAAARAQVDNIGEALGKRLIPIITDALGAASKFIGWLNDHTVVLYTLGAVIGTVVVTAILAYIATLVKSAAESAVQFAKMAASAVTWAARTAAQVATAVASFAVWAAQGIAQGVAAAATGFASMIASGASWMAQQAVQLAESAAGFVAWAAEHAVMAAGFIAENIAMAASATAAFVAENAATLGIVAGIALIVGAIVYMATHWTQVWGVIKAVAEAVWDWLKGAFGWITGVFFDGIKIYLTVLGTFWGAVWNGVKAVVVGVWDFLKGAFDWLVSSFFAGIRLYVGILGSVWGAVWSGVRSAVSGAWSVIQGIWSGLQGGIGAVRSAISDFGGVWSAIWNGVKSAVSAAWSFIAPIVNTIKGAISAVSSGISAVKGFAGSVGSFLGFDNGGPVPGPVGKPMLAVVHGGEYVLSNDMLTGRQEPTDLLKAQSANGYTGASSQPAAPAAPVAASGGGQSVTVYATTNADPQRIAADVGWALRAMA